MTKWIVLVAAVIMAGALIYVAKGRTSRRAACRTLVAACEQAGFRLGPTHTERREFRKSCLKPIFRDNAFRGLEFDPSIVSKCKARLERFKGRLKNS